MEPRKSQCGSPRRSLSGGRAAAPLRSGACRPAGVEEQGVGTQGFFRNLGDPGSSPCDHVRQWGPEHEPLARGRRSGPTGAKPQTQRMVASGEGNRVRREGRRKSEHLIVPLHAGNSTRGDPRKGRGCPVTESLEGNRAGARKPEDMSTQQQRIAERAQRLPEAGFTSLAHLMDREWLHRAFYRTRADGAVGVDGQTAED